MCYILFTMNSLENSLNKIAETILHFDEASLTLLWDKYKSRMEHFSFSADWEKSVIIFSIINSVRVKNAIFNEQMLKAKTDGVAAAIKKPHSVKPNLKLVK